MKLGKISNINIIASKKAKQTLETHGITKCEVTGSTNFLTIAHRFKRIYYRNCPELLWDINHILLLRQDIHDGIEHDRDATEKLFIEKRGIMPKSSINTKQKSSQKKGNKADWMKPHKCKCGNVLSGLLCPKCGNMSI